MGTIFRRLLIGEGFPIDAVHREKLTGSPMEMTRAILTGIYQATLNRMTKAAHLVVVKIGHDDSDERLKGRILSISLEKYKSADGSARFGIFGRIEMNEPWAKDVARGLYPRASIEICDGMVDPGGAKIGTYISGVAILGISQPAFHGAGAEFSIQTMEKFHMEKTMKKKNPNWLKRFFGKPNQKFEAYDPKAILALIEDAKAAMEEISANAGTENYDLSGAMDVLTSFITMVSEMVETMGESADAPDAPVEATQVEAAAKPTEDTEKYSTLVNVIEGLTARIAEIEITHENAVVTSVDRTFQTLVAGNHAQIGDRASFAKFAAATSLEEAELFFAQRTAKAPSQVKPPARSGSAFSVVDQERVDSLVASGKSKATAESYVKSNPLKETN